MGEFVDHLKKMNYISAGFVMECTMEKGEVFIEKLSLQECSAECKEELLQLCDNLREKDVLWESSLERVETWLLNQVRHHIKNEKINIDQFYNDQEVYGIFFLKEGIPFVHFSCDKLITRAKSKENSLKGRRLYISDNITAKRNAESILEKENQRYKDILEATKLGTWEYNILTGEMVVNERWAEMIGYTLEELEPITMDTWNNFTHTSDIDRAYKLLQEHIAGKSSEYEAEFRMRHKKRYWVWIHDRGRIIRRTPDGKPWMMYGGHNEITEKKYTQEMLQHTEKLNALGRLAGGIAHDINNQLMMIRGYIDIMFERNTDLEQDEYLAKIDGIVTRSASVVKQLLTFSKQSKFESEPIDIVSVVKSIGEMLIHTLDKSIVVKLDMEEEHLVITADRSLVENAIINLCINAKDAMPDGGKLQLSIEKKIFDKETQTFTGHIKPGTYAMIRVTDNGKGISEGDLHRIFEPFFTTKDTGTGVGLSAVIGVIKQHKGGIRVVSNEGKGSCFSLYFPIEDHVEIEKGRIAKKPVGKGLYYKNIMIVDDEAVLLSVLDKYLSSKGCYVKTFSDPRQVIEYYKTHSKEIEVIILDMLMPYMSGIEVFKHLVGINNNVKVLYLSGYTEGFEVDDEYKKNVIGYIEKPVRLSQIYEMLQKDE